MQGKEVCDKVLSRREMLKRSLYGGLTASLAPSLWLSGCGSSKGRKDKLNVILISIDTLRADHVGCYGYERNTSPNIDFFAEKNILFKNCFIHEPSTTQSHMSMLTGLYPFTHGVSPSSGLALSRSRKTLAEVLRNEGYLTLGFVRQCGQMCANFGFARGFDLYVIGGHYEFIAESQNKFMARYLKESKDDRLFLFVHYYDIHSDFEKLPYDSPPPYNEMFCPDYKGNFTGGDGKLYASKYLANANKKKVRFKQDDLEYIAALYDGGVAYTDKCVGDLFAMLKKFGLYDNSLIILTSDHGEEFQEHGFMLHENPCYYEGLVRVPMIIKLPGTGVAGKVVTRLVENIDIMPSILAWLGVRNVPRMQGDNFMRLIDDPQAQWKDIVFGYSVKDGPRAFVRSSRWKLLTPNIQQDQQFKMFDLSSDPQEKLDITGNRGDVTEQLKAKLLDRYMKLEKPGPQKEVSITPKQLEILKSLGYVQ